MAEENGSSEEFVDDDSGEDEQEEDEGSSASYGEEAQEDEDADGDDSEAFETPQKAKKRPKVSQPSAQKGSGASAKRKGTAAPTAPPSTANETPNKEAVKSPTNTSKKGTSASKGKGRAGASKSTKAMPSQDGSARSTPDSTLSALKGTKVDKPSPAALDMGDTASLSGSAAAPASSNSVPIMSNGARAGGADASADSIPAVKSAAKTPKAAVRDYMLQSNRPYSCINVFDNLHKKIPKPMVQKLLDELTRDGAVKTQEYGKSKIYYANQDALPNGAGEVSDAKLKKLEQDAATLTSKLEVASTQARAAQSRVQALTSQPTDALLEEKLTSATTEVEQMETQNETIKGQGRSAVAGGMKQAKTDFHKFRTMWLTRKRNAVDVVDMICDGMEKKPKVVMEILGVEADEEPIPAKM